MEEQLLEILKHSLANKPVWAVVIAFAGGILSSISPCVLSVIPIIMGYVAATTESDKISNAFRQSLLFVIGLVIILTIIGVVSALAGQAISAFIGPYWYVILGILAIIMGLSILEVFYLPFPQFIKEMPTKNYGKVITPIILGMAFGIVATPCSTPILLALICYVAYEGSILFGIIMLIAYAFGHSILLLIAGTFAGVIKHIGKLRKWTSYIIKVSGVLLILVGLYLLIYAFWPQLLIW